MEWPQPRLQCLHCAYAYAPCPVKASILLARSSRAGCGGIMADGRCRRHVPRAVRLCLQRAEPSLLASDLRRQSGFREGAFAASTKGDSGTGHAIAVTPSSVVAASARDTVHATASTRQSRHQARTPPPPPLLAALLLREQPLLVVLLPNLKAKLAHRLLLQQCRGSATSPGRRRLSRSSTPRPR